MEHCHAAAGAAGNVAGNSWWRACAGSGSSESSKLIKGVSADFRGRWPYDRICTIDMYAQKRAKEHMFCTACCAADKIPSDTGNSGR